MNASTDAEPCRPLKIFVVENHADTLHYMKMYLESLGHAVLTARTMRQALDTLPEAHCDVLISDIGLPDGDGWELLQTLQARGQTPAFAIAMSGLGTNSDYARSGQAGYRHHLLKPFKPEEFDGLLEEAAHELPLPS